MLSENVNLVWFDEKVGNIAVKTITLEYEGKIFTIANCGENFEDFTKDNYELFLSVFLPDKERSPRIQAIWEKWKNDRTLPE